MGTRDKRVDAYIRKAAEFAQPILERTREAFHAGCPDVVETMKWSTPAFEHHSILGGMAAFKAHVRIGFWRGADLPDPEGIFEQVSETEMAAFKCGDISELPSKRVLAQYVKRAAKANEDRAADKGAGKPAAKRGAAKKKAAKKKRAAPRTPKILSDALAKNAAAKKTFAAFSPTNKREYIEWITEAKQEKTRDKRLATALEWMAEGKRRNWKYERPKK